MESDVFGIYRGMLLFFCNIASFWTLISLERFHRYRRVCKRIIPSSDLQTDLVLIYKASKLTHYLVEDMKHGF